MLWYIIDVDALRVIGWDWDNHHRVKGVGSAPQSVTRLTFAPNGMWWKRHRVVTLV